MWDFKASQMTFQIGKVKIGGRPGERPIVLIGSIFYAKHKIVTDFMKGVFDREAAEKLIKRQEEYSDKTGNPHMIDVVASTSEAMIRFLDFVSDVTDAPICIDGVSSDVRIAALRYIRESSLKNPVVYNSLVVYEYRSEELEVIKETKINSAILLAYSSKDFTASGRVRAIRDLLPKAYEAGIEYPLIDTCVIDLPSIGSACNALYEIKDETGLPVGCGAHNAIDTWRGLKRRMTERAIDPSIAGSSVIAATVGADWILYGPIDNADLIFPAIAMVDVAISQHIIESGGHPQLDHPVFKVA